MSAFQDRLSQIVPRLEDWWHHEDQEKPCIIASALKDSHGPIPETENLEKFWTDVDFITDRNMALIDNTDYFGQSVPFHYIDHGSAAMACVYGARPEYVDRETIWAHPTFRSIEDILDIGIASDNQSWQTIVHLTNKSVEKSRNHHFVGMFALMGMTDILAGLYGIESFMIDLLYKPDLVARVMNTLKENWIDTFNYMNDVIHKSNNNGYNSWHGIWSPGTTFPIQEDVSYMISTEHFRTFCLPHICDFVDAMQYPFFHLDGIGMIPHLDGLLDIPKLKVIQWQPGAGKERLDQWYDLIQKILAAGKSVQVFARAEEVDALISHVGTRGMLVSLTDSDPQTLKQTAEKYA